MSDFQRYRHQQIDRIQALAQQQAITHFTHGLYCRGTDFDCELGFMLRVGARELSALAHDLLEVNR